MIAKHSIALCREQHTLGTLAIFAWQEIARQRLTNCEEISEADGDKNSEYSDEVLPDDDKTKDKVSPVKITCTDIFNTGVGGDQKYQLPPMEPKARKNSKKRDS